MADDKKESCSSPNEAIFFVLAYLPVFELLAMAGVCRSLRDAIDNDLLLWLKIVVAPPLNWRISDEILAKITSKANGRLTVLALFDCVRITDEGLLRVVAQNPHITKLLLPGCTSLTPQGIVKAVKLVHQIQSLQINGIYGFCKQQLEKLIDQTHHCRTSLYHEHKKLSTHERIKTDLPIDVQICPKCKQVGMVYDCPSNICQNRKEKWVGECKGCLLCIRRCVDCGVCVRGPEEESLLCSDNLCLDCWLVRPKCNFCNKPFCRRHGEEERGITVSTSSGFVCAACIMRFN